MTRCTRLPPHLKAPLGLEPHDWKSRLELKEGEGYAERWMGCLPPASFAFVKRCRGNGQIQPISIYFPIWAFVDTAFESTIIFFPVSTICLFAGVILPDI